MAMLESAVKISELPDLWKAKMKDYLGDEPSNNSEGVLQDVHWSGGSFGSFPGYTIGNIMAAQVFAAAHDAMPNLETTLEEGNYAPLLTWLTENIYKHGRAYSVSELLQRISGEDLHVGPYLASLEAKFSDLYGLS